MSRLLSLHNRLKAQAGETRLAVHQNRAYERIVSLWRFPARLNLYGPAGCGKTYLGWVLATKYETRFLSGPEQLTETVSFRPNETVIIDNTNPDPYVVRRLLAVLDLHNIRRVLLISRAPAADILPTIGMDAPTLDELEEVRRNLRDVGCQCTISAQRASLWALVRGSLS